VTPAPYAIFANTASNLLGGVTVAQLGNGAVSANTSGTVILRDASGSFAAGNIVATNLVLPTNVANIYGGTNTILRYDNQNGNFLAGNAGNSTTTGTANVGIGISALSKNTSANQNTAVGAYALQNNTTGIQNTGIG